MELIREALEKAKISGAAQRDARALRPEVVSPASAEFWSLPRALLDIKHLEQQRVIAYAMTDPSHAAFNLLRTKVGKAMKDNRWKSLAVLSPTTGCGKTTVCVNLALSLARQTDYRTVLIDLDLKRSAMGRTLGIQTKASMSDYLAGDAELQHCCIRVGENLIVGVNNKTVKMSSEMLSEDNIKRLLATISTLRPDFVLFDLPPMLASDDALAFLPHVDCSILIAAAGKTTAGEVDECERQARGASNFIGVVLNKCQMESTEYYQYGPE